jgi:LDH2 family malate/lactate/ureidoglycolate dehydrogenase
MSMTKMIEENSEREAPRESGVMLPGQSHISRGMTVLVHGIEVRRGRK